MGEGRAVRVNVFAQAFKVDGTYLVYAWSPAWAAQGRDCERPGLGGVLFDSVDQDGEWQIGAEGASIH